MFCRNVWGPDAQSLIRRMAVLCAQPPPEFITRGVRELDEAERSAAQQVLLDRFAQGKDNMSAHNRKVVNTLLGFGHCALHCHRANCELGRAELGRFGCALGMVGGRCVAAAVFRHVPAASRREGWSELLLLAVRRDEERRGYGTAMVEYVRRLSAASGASLLVVISNGSAFWQRPALRLGELAAAEAGRYPCFVPWSHGIKLLGSRPEAAAGFDGAAVAEERVDGNRAASHPAQQAGALGDPQHSPEQSSASEGDAAVEAERGKVGRLRLPPSRLATPGARGKRRAEVEVVEAMEASPSALLSPAAGGFAEPAQAVGSRSCTTGRPQQCPAARKKTAAAGQGTKAVAPSAAVAGRGTKLVSLKTAAAQPEFVSRGMRELEEAQRSAAQQVLLDRFAQGRDDKSAHNRKVVNTLLGCMPHRARTPGEHRPQTGLLLTRLILALHSRPLRAALPPRQLRARTRGARQVWLRARDGGRPVRGGGGVSARSGCVAARGLVGAALAGGAAR